MFTGLSPLQTDPILTLMQAFRDDPRREKVDLGVGIWREPDGTTPVFRAVKMAEQALWQQQETKAYTGLLGDPCFAESVAKLLFGTVPAEMAAAATVGGTSAVRQLLALTRAARPDARIWIPAQTWPNHWALAADLGLEVQPYAWLNRKSGRLDRDALLHDLSGLRRDDVVILQACCHNPTGVDADADLQAVLFDLMAREGAVPLIDAAYLGFGDAPEADTQMIRAAHAFFPEVMVAFSGSKSFGLYRERVGLALVLSDAKGIVESHLAVLNRMDFTFPPDHGARCVSMILNELDLKAVWLEELSAIRTSLGFARHALAKALRERLQADSFNSLVDLRGMFALLPLGEARVQRLRDEYAVYVVGDGRINLAGVTPKTVGRVADALASVLRT